MATRNLTTKTLGNVKHQSGEGYPNHFAPKNSFYTDILTDNKFKNLDSTDNGWVLLEKGYKEIKQENTYMELKSVTDRQMFLIKNPKHVLLFNSDRKIAVLHNGTKWVSLLSEELHPIIFKDSFEKNKFGPQWSVLNGNEKNFWVVEKNHAKTGFYSAFITNNGHSNSFTGKESDVHIFFDIFIPKGIKDLRLYVDYNGGAEGQNGFGIISIAPVSYFPKAGELVEEQFIKNAIYKSDKWTKAFSSLGNNFAGQNARIILSWHNEQTTKEIQSLNIDKISLEYLK